MMARYELWKAKKEADAKLAAELAAEEQARLLKFDKSKLPKHLALFAFEKKTRKALDDAAEKLQGKPDAPRPARQAGGLAAQGHRGPGQDLARHGSTGREFQHRHRSRRQPESLANDYPEAIAASFQGDAKPLAAARAELDKREKRLTSWLAEVKSGKK